MSRGFAKTFGVNLRRRTEWPIAGHTQEETAKRLGYSPRLMANASFRITFL
jgi:hypothetical protein